MANDSPQTSNHGNTSSFPVIVHPFQSPTPDSCAYEIGSKASSNALIFIGGLTGGPHPSRTPLTLAHGLADASELNYSVWEFRMRSSYSGFGFSSIANDVEDIKALVTYLRSRGKNKIVLMGVSTGCQDCIEYTNHVKYDTPPVDGYILQSPVSDRETAGMSMPADYLEATIATAKQMIAEGKQEDAMPRHSIPPVFSSLVTAYRWNSLAAKGGDDDFFSSDIRDDTLDTTFGRFDRPVLLMPAGEDELVPSTVDKEKLLARWMKACPHGLVSPLSAVNPTSDHSVTDSMAQGWMLERIMSFLKTI
ncbi:hypothetical protein BN1723_010711 [Verticillium longisporum]|uniref:AB hydrolase-1 domain-containing protein n=1 Tax=Verticillium longisporum TaxID=100787 RepID=A0A0G4L1F9_VERLO|nr:hypothetical protein BN1723_010711 [Verticillium longisporum]CRK28729.1 hypothetical protein BN1708_004712 [Verticillium longisporum]